LKDRRSFSQYWADKVTAFSGSWAFIFLFGAGCFTWVMLNVTTSFRWDPYPFMFLNWTLNALNTFQSPLILLSQNRQNETDKIKTDEILRRLEELQAAIDELKNK